MGLRMIGLKCQGPVQAGKRFLILAKPHQGLGQIQLGCGVTRIDGHGAAQKRGGIRRPPKPCHRKAGKVASIRMPRFTLEQAEEAGLSGGEVPLAHQANGFGK